MSHLNRREFLFGSLSLAALGPSLSLGQAPRTSFKGDVVFNRLVRIAKEEGLAQLPIGEIVGRIGMALIGTPYVGNTLELSDHDEICSINLDGLDCVTLFECSLDFARIVKKGNLTKEAFLAAVRETRYRGGRQGNYLSRLHYTSDWIWDNDRRHTVKDLTPSLLGAERVTQKVGFMSAHPESYLQLRTDPKLVPGIHAIEARINARPNYYLPMSKVAENEHLLQTGDIVGITTTEPGIDVAHTGLCYRAADGVLHFLDASSMKSKMRVTFEGRLSQSILWSQRNTGIVVARPLEPHLGR